MCPALAAPDRPHLVARRAGRHHRLQHIRHLGHHGVGHVHCHILGQLQGAREHVLQEEAAGSRSRERGVGWRSHGCERMQHACAHSPHRLLRGHASRTANVTASSAAVMRQSAAGCCRRGACARPRAGQAVSSGCHGGPGTALSIAGSNAGRICGPGLPQFGDRKLCAPQPPRVASTVPGKQTRVRRFVFHAGTGQPYPSGQQDTEKKPTHRPPSSHLAGQQAPDVGGSCQGRSLPGTRRGGSGAPHTQPDRAPCGRTLLQALLQSDPRRPQEVRRCGDAVADVSAPHVSAALAGSWLRPQLGTAAPGAPLRCARIVLTDLTAS